MYGASWLWMGPEMEVQASKRGSHSQTQVIHLAREVRKGTLVTHVQSCVYSFIEYLAVTEGRWVQKHLWFSFLLSRTTVPRKPPSGRVPVGPRSPAGKPLYLRPLTDAQAWVALAVWS